MVPQVESLSDDDPTESDTLDIDRGELYLIINKAVEDAILGALGTILLVGVSIVLIWFGMIVTVSAYDSSILRAIGGVVVTLLGLYFAGSTLELIPSITDLFGVAGNWGGH